MAEVLFPNTIPPFFPSGQPRRRGRRRRRVRAALGGPAGAQPVDGRLLRRRAGPAGRHGADLPQRRRRRGRGDPLGARARAASAASCCPACRPTPGCRRSSPPTTSRSGRCARSSSMPINNHSGAAGPDFGDYAAVDGRVHGRARLVLAPGVLAHGVRRRVRPRYPGLKLVLTEQSAGWVPGILDLLDHHYAALPRHAGTGERRTSAARSPTRARGRPERVLGAPTATRARASSGRRRRRCATRSASTRSCGARTTRTSRAPTRTRSRRCATPSPASTPTRWRAMVGGNAAARLRLRPRRARTGRRTGRPDRGGGRRAARPRSRPTVVSIAFAGEEVKPW